MSAARFTYSDLIDYSTEQMQLPRQEVHQRLRILMDIVQQGLIRDGQVSIPGLGIFKLKWQAERIGRNPQTGESMTVPGHQRVLFNPETGLRRFINRKYGQLTYTEIPEPTESILPDEDEPVVIPLSSGTMRAKSVNDEKEIRYVPAQRRFKLRWLFGLIALILLVWLILSLCKNKSETNPSQKPVTSESIQKEPAPVAESNKETNVQNPQPIKPVVMTFPESIYTVRTGDRLWDISDAHYQTAYYWPAIYHANQSQLRRPDALVPGLLLKLPALEYPDSKLSSGDNVKLAEGYFSVYIIYSKTGESDAYHYLWAARELDPSLDFNQIPQKDLQRIRGMKGRLRLH